MMELNFEQYAAEIEKLEDLPPATIELSPLEAIAIISHIQLAIRHPALADKSGFTKVAIDVALQLQALFNPESTVYKVLELGWDSDEDLPRYTPPADFSWAKFFGLGDDNGDNDHESFDNYIGEAKLDRFQDPEEERPTYYENGKFID